MNCPRVLFLTLSYIQDRGATLECIRRHHWRRHWECLRSGDKRQAAYHRKLAESIEK